MDTKKEGVPKMRVMPTEPPPGAEPAASVPPRAPAPVPTDIRIPRTQLVLLGVLLFVVAGGAGLLFLDITPRSPRNAQQPPASSVVETPQVQDEPPGQVLETSQEEPEEASPPVPYTSFKLIRRDQRLVAALPSGERTVLVPSIQRALPALPVERELALLEPAPVTGTAFFSTVRPDTDAGDSVFYSFNSERESFEYLTVLDELYPGFGTPAVSPDGLAFLSGVDGEGRNLYFVDLTSDTATLLHTLPEGETYIRARGVADVPLTDLAWIDDTTIETGIYAMGEEPNFLRRERLTISRPPVPVGNNVRYALESTVDYSYTDQALVGFTETGEAVTLVESVHAALPELQPNNFLVLEASDPESDTLLFRSVHTDQSYSYGLRTGTFSPSD